MLPLGNWLMVDWGKPWWWICCMRKCNYCYCQFWSDNWEFCWLGGRFG